MLTRIFKKRANDRAAVAVEYSLIVGGVVLLLVAALTLFGPRLNDFVTTVGFGEPATIGDTVAEDEDATGNDGDGDSTGDNEEDTGGDSTGDDTSGDGDDGNGTGGNDGDTSGTEPTSGLLTIGHYGHGDNDNRVRAEDPIRSVVTVYNRASGPVTDIFVTSFFGNETLTEVEVDCPKTTLAGREGMECVTAPYTPTQADFEAEQVITIATVRARTGANGEQALFDRSFEGIHYFMNV